MKPAQQTNSLDTFLGGETDQQAARVDDSVIDVGTRLAEARAAAGYTQAEVANQLGVKASTLAKWEMGTSSPRSNRLQALAGILGVSLSWLIVGHGSEPTTSTDLDEARTTLHRVQTQLSEALAEVEALLTRLDHTTKAG